MHRPGDNIVPLSSQGRSSAESFRAEHRRELLTILFTDLANSTQLQSDLGNLEAALLTEMHRQLVREALARFEAREIVWAGDSCLAVFVKPSDGVAFALRLQAALHRARAHEPRTPHVRIGLHVGEIVVRHREDGSKSDDLFGLQVSETARVMSLARADQIYCTRSVFDNARSALKNEAIEGVGTVAWRNYGLFELKGSDEPAEICEVGEEGLAPLLPPAANDKCMPIKGDIEKWRKRRAKGNRGPASTLAWTLAPVGMVALLVGAILGRYFLPSVVDQNRLATDLSVVQPEVSAPTTRLTLRLPAGFAPREFIKMAISPRGDTLVFYGDNMPAGAGLYIRQMNDFDDVTTELPRTTLEEGVCFSPDGDWVAYTQSKKITKLQLSTGITEVLATHTGAYIQGGAWGEDGSILFGSEQGLHLIRAQDGQSTLITHTDRSKGEVFHSAPAWIPGKNVLLYTIWTKDETDAQIVLLSLDSGESKVLLTGGTGPRYSPTGHLIYGLAGRIWAAPFDLNRAEITGKAQAVVDGVATGGTKPSFSFSENGTLVYVAGVTSTMGLQFAPRELVWMTQDGTTAPLDLDADLFLFPSLSPDGQRLVAQIGTPGLARIHLIDLQRGTRFPLTLEPDSSQIPVWSPAENLIAFRRGGSRLYCMKPAVNEQPRLVVQAVGSVLASSWSPDGKELVYTQRSPKGLEIFGVSVVDENAIPRQLVHIEGDASLGRVSPDGEWLAYTANTTGRQEIWVQSYNASTSVQPFLITTQGGRDSMWSRDGKTLYFLNNENSALFRVSTDKEPSKWGLPEQVCKWDPLTYVPSPYAASYDVAPDGRFIFARDITAQATLEIRAVVNWFEELKRLVPIAETK